MEDIKTATGMFGAIEAFVTFIFVLGTALATTSVSTLDFFMAFLIMASGLLMAITCLE